MARTTRNVDWKNIRKSRSRWNVKREVKAIRRSNRLAILDGVDLLAPEAEAFIPTQAVPTYHVFRYGQTYIDLTGRTDLHPNDAAGFLDLPASQCNDGDFCDSYALKMAERAEDWDWYNGQIRAAEAQLAEAIAFENYLVGNQF